MHIAINSIDKSKNSKNNDSGHVTGIGGIVLYHGASKVNSSPSLFHYCFCLMI